MAVLLRPGIVPCWCVFGVVPGVAQVGESLRSLLTTNFNGYSIQLGSIVAQGVDGHEPSSSTELI